MARQTAPLWNRIAFFVTKEVSPVAAAEIGALQYFSLDEYLQQPNTAPGAIMILQQLKAGGYID